MFDFLKKKARVESSVLKQLAGNPFFELHRRYWTPDPAELSSLQQNLGNLSDARLLRLLHLIVLERRDFLLDPDQDEDQVDSGFAPAVTPILEKLRRPDSPYRPCKGAVWLGDAGESGEREPDRAGDLTNASLTHLGSLEVITLDEQQQPLAVEFIPFDNIRGLVLAPPSMFRPARIFFEDGRPDAIVVVPLIYGLSWNSPQEHDHNGTMTRFCWHVPTEDKSYPVGLGQQDWVVESSEGASLMGIGRIGELMVYLQMTDPKFDEKCRARGLDPDEVRNRMPK